LAWELDADVAPPVPRLVLVPATDVEEEGRKGFEEVDERSLQLSISASIEDRRS